MDIENITYQTAALENESSDAAAEEMTQAPRLIVSCTSYPARIQYVSSMLKTIYRQTLQADEVILWLAEEQFPEKEQELPQELLDDAAEGRLSIRWCEDLKPHKKYFYACQEYPDDIIVTVDDDLLYRSDLLQTLYDSWERYPDAVSTVRAHLITITEEGEILPYRLWIKETDYMVHTPSMHLFATNGAGTLFPPHILPSELFDIQAIRDTCLMADDLWLKTMELYADIPVVLAENYAGIRYVEGSQDTALYMMNKTPMGNDRQLENIVSWARKHLGTDIWSNKLFHLKDENNPYCTEFICEHATHQIEKYKSNASKANREKNTLNKSYMQASKEINGLNAKLQKANGENQKLNAENQKLNAELQKKNQKLQQMQSEKFELNAKIQRTYQEKSELNAKLQRTYQEKSELNAKLQQTYQEKRERGEKIKEMESHFLVKLDRKLHAIYRKIFRKG